MACFGEIRARPVRGWGPPRVRGPAMGAWGLPWSACGHAPQIRNRQGASPAISQIGRYRRRRSVRRWQGSHGLGNAWVLGIAWAKHFERIYVAWGVLGAGLGVGVRGAPPNALSCLQPNNIPCSHSFSLAHRRFQLSRGEPCVRGRYPSVIPARRSRCSAWWPEPMPQLACMVGDTLQ